VIEMSDRTKDLILKTLLIIDMFLLFMIGPGLILISFLISDEKIVAVVFNTSLFAMFGVGILFVILLRIFGGFNEKSVKAEKVPLLFASYDELLTFLEKQLLQKEYQKQKTINVLTSAEVTVYEKASKLWELDCFTIIRIPELTEKSLEDTNDSITDILTEYYDGETITDRINMISVFCVDRITPAFQRLVNTNTQQGLKNGRLVVGISFGGKNIYIAQQKNGFFITKYKSLRKEFIDIMDLQYINK